MSLHSRATKTCSKATRGGSPTASAAPARRNPGHLLGMCDARPPPMYTKVHIAKHPVHPMLVAFPVAFYTATLVSFVVYAVSTNPFWFKVGLVANVAGVIMAAVAAVPGFID